MLCSLGEAHKVLKIPEEFWASLKKYWKVIASCELISELYKVSKKSRKVLNKSGKMLASFKLASKSFMQSYADLEVSYRVLIRLKSPKDFWRILEVWTNLKEFWKFSVSCELKKAWTVLNESGQILECSKLVTKSFKEVLDPGP